MLQKLNTYKGKMDCFTGLFYYTNRTVHIMFDDLTSCHPRGPTLLINHQIKNVGVTMRQKRNQDTMGTILFFLNWNDEITSLSKSRECSVWIFPF
jgi:hypothetical protein